MTKQGRVRAPPPPPAWPMLASKLVHVVADLGWLTEEMNPKCRGRRAELTAEVAPSSVLLDGEASKMPWVRGPLLVEAQGLGRQIHVLTEMAVELARARWVGRSRCGSRDLRCGAG